jgi:hypothetical protein
MIAADSGSGGKAPDGPAGPLFAEHCEKCHTGRKHKGDFQIESLSQDFSDQKNVERWVTVLEQLKAGDMPPEEKPRPPAPQVEAVVQWIS